MRNRYASFGRENEGDALKRPPLRHMARAGGQRVTWRALCFCCSMRNGRFLVFDLDEDLTARFGNADYAIRFARWLARGRSEELTVVVSDEARWGTIVWPEPQLTAVPNQCQLTASPGL